MRCGNLLENNAYQNKKSEKCPGVSGALHTVDAFLKSARLCNEPYRLYDCVYFRYWRICSCCPFRRYVSGHGETQCYILASQTARSRHTRIPQETVLNMHNKPTSIILGLSFYYHDSAAALIVDGKVVAATQEERFTRIKHDKAFPIHSAEFCLVSQGLSIGDVDTVAFYDKPIVKFERLLQSYIRTWPKGLRSFLLGMESALTKNLWVERPIRKTLGFLGEILYTEHHIAHAASSYYCSGFSDATVVTMDGVGEWDTTTVGSGRGSTLALTEHIEFPHSLGLLYSALTYYLGFKVNSAEYKVMGLAPYGDPKRFEKEMRKLIDIKNDGSFKLTMRYFAYEYGLVMTNKAFDRLFGAPPRHPDVLLTQREKDIAASLQMITEE